MLTRLIKQYCNVSLLRQNPGDTPYSVFLLIITGTIFFILIVLQWILTDISHKLTTGNVMLIAGSLVLSYILYTWIVLALYGLHARCVQTLTCLFAGHTVVHLMACPLLLFVPIMGHLHTSLLIGALIGITYLILTLILTVWQFMVSVYIYRQALEKDYLSGILASLGLLACNILTISLW